MCFCLGAHVGRILGLKTSNRGMALAKPRIAYRRSLPAFWSRAPSHRWAIKPFVAAYQTSGKLISTLVVSVRPTTSEEELQQAAQLRAEAYHEERVYGRFKQSFIRQFAQQEARQLKWRTALAAEEPSPHWLTLVAASPSAPAKCVGTLDVRVATAQQLESFGVDPEAARQDGTRAAYLSNVAVDASSRGRGIGRQLIASAQKAARGTLGAERLYTHVDADNEAAQRLYMKCGFEAVVTVSEGRRPNGTRFTGGPILMRCPL